MRLDRLSEAAKVNTDAMRSAQEEISEYRRQLQARTTELETLKSTKEKKILIMKMLTIKFIEVTKSCYAVGTVSVLCTSSYLVSPGAFPTLHKQ